MRTFNKMTMVKSFKVATMVGGEIKFVGKSLTGEAEKLVDQEGAHIWKYGVTARKYLDKLNAKARLNAEGKARSKNTFYLVDETVI